MHKILCNNNVYVFLCEDSVLITCAQLLHWKVGCMLNCIAQENCMQVRVCLLRTTQAQCSGLFITRGEQVVWHNNRKAGINLLCHFFSAQEIVCTCVYAYFALPMGLAVVCQLWLRISVSFNKFSTISWATVTLIWLSVTVWHCRPNRLNSGHCGLLLRGDRRIEWPEMAEMGITFVLPIPDDVTIVQVP